MFFIIQYFNLIVMSLICLTTSFVKDDIDMVSQDKYMNYISYDCSNLKKNQSNLVLKFVNCK
jgi:hypothetical protein